MESCRGSRGAAWLAFLPAGVRGHGQAVGEAAGSWGRGYCDPMTILKPILRSGHPLWIMLPAAHPHAFPGASWALRQVTVMRPVSLCDGSLPSATPLSTREALYYAGLRAPCSQQGRAQPSLCVLMPVLGDPGALQEGH